jgi:hypothetical protein
MPAQAAGRELVQGYAQVFSSSPDVQRSPIYPLLSVKKLHASETGW